MQERKQVMFTPTGLNFGAFNVRRVVQDWQKENLEEDDKGSLIIAAITEIRTGRKNNRIVQGEYIIYTVHVIFYKHRLFEKRLGNILIFKFQSQLSAIFPSPSPLNVCLKCFS